MRLGVKKKKKKGLDPLLNCHSSQSFSNLKNKNKNGKQDIVNEPDSRGIRWSSGPNNQGPGMQELYVEAMDAIAEVR